MPNWIPVVKREIYRYQRRTGSDTVSIDDLFEQARPRLELQFPETDTLRASLERTLETLEDRDEVTQQRPEQYQISSHPDIRDVALSGVSDSGIAILHNWGAAIETEATGDYFAFVGDDAHDPSGVGSLVEEFLQAPSGETFSAFWDELSSAARAGSATAILEKWADAGKSLDELAGLIEDIRDAATYNKQWEEELGAKRTVWELYGLLHIEDAPLMTGRTHSGLELFGYPTPDEYSELRDRFEDFKLDYLEHCGHRTEETSHSVPLNIEIDQLFRVIHQVEKGHVDDSTDPERVLAVYRAIIDQQYEALPAMVRTAPRDVGLHYVLKEIARRYPDEVPQETAKRKTSNYPRIQGWFKQEAVPAIETCIANASLDLEYSVAEGIGQGYIPHIPYLAVYDDRHTDSTQRGIYVVYLFDPSTDSVYLTLNQGAKEATKLAGCGSASSYEVLTRLATQFAGEISDQITPYEREPAPLSRAVQDISGNANARKYSKGTICYERYTPSDLVPGAQESVASHLAGFLESYAGLLDRITRKPELAAADRDIWGISPGSGGRFWGLYRDAGLASLGHGQYDMESVRTAGESERQSWSDQHGKMQLYRFAEAVTPGDIVLAAAQKDNLDRIYGIGVVTSDYDDTDASSLLADLDSEVDLGHDHFIGVDWYTVADRGLPITTVGDRDIVHQWTLEQYSETEGTQLHALASRRKAVLEPDDTPEGIAGEIEAALGLSDDMVDDELTPIDDDATARYYFLNQGTGPDTTAIAGDYLEQPADDAWYHNLRKLEPGDILFNYHGGEFIGYSEVTSEAYPRRDDDGTLKQRIDVEYTEFTEPLAFSDVHHVLVQDEFRLEKYDAIKDTGFNQKYLLCLSEKAGDYLLKRGRLTRNVDRLEDRLTLPSVSVDLPDSLYFPGDTAADLEAQIEAALNGGKHVVFTGPPGTGKSKLATSVADQLEARDAIDGSLFTTATAEWTAYDTIGGYMPSGKREGDTLEFSRGQFLRCFRSETGDVSATWLVIDELNRASIDKAFGQLFSVLSGDSVELPYEREDTISIDWVDRDTPKEERQAIATNPDRFPVTPAWRLLGTMNTADKTSLYEMSFAFMRRFAFIHVGIPDLRTADDAVKAWLLDPSADASYAETWAGVDGDDKDGVSPQYVTYEEMGERLAVLWANINDHHPIGPALIKDIGEYVTAYSIDDTEAALRNAVVSLVFPQLEGLRPAEQKALVRQIDDRATVVDAAGETSSGVAPGVDVSALKTTAEDMFNIEFDGQDDT